MIIDDNNVDGETSRMIVPMDETSIRRIVAGQAVTDMASAIKELVDNALDAGATTINIRLFNQGIDAIEVSDDGSGVPAASRPYMAQKHATSKISTFDDIYTNGGDTLGFRGEALFCLANLSGSLVVVTKTAQDEMAQKLHFQRDGSMSPTTSVQPRKVGTTVSVLKLFDALPVRRADFCKRIQVQRSKVLALMQGYAILCLGVKFSLMDCKGGREDVKMRTAVSADRVEQTVSSVLGSRFLAGMCKIEIDLSKALNHPGAKVSGLISKPPSTTNNQAIARESQFFSINRRPVELPKLSKVLNELWRSLDSGQKKRPACILQFTLSKSSFDVNLSPDKRDVMLTDHDVICDMVREHVQQLWAAAGTFPQSRVVSQEPIIAKIDETERQRQVQLRMDPVHENFETVKLQHDQDNDYIHGASTITMTNVERQQWNDVRQRFRESDEGDVQTISKNNATPTVLRDAEPHSSVCIVTDDSKRKMTLEDFAFHPLGSRKQVVIKAGVAIKSRRETTAVVSEELERRQETYVPAEQDIRATSNRIRNIRAADGAMAGEPNPTKRQRNEEPSPSSTSAIYALVGADNKCQSIAEEDDTEEEDKDEVPDEVTWIAFDGTESVTNATMATRRKQRQAHLKLKLLKSVRRVSTDTSNTIDKTVESIKADTEMNPGRPTVQLSKSDIGEMQVLGQFNLGFILCKSRKDHQLWILDQHACDEKYNFESLCRDTKFNEQRLIKPIPLELSPSEETCILEHRDVFKANGFRFDYKEDLPPRHRLSLTTLPHSGARDGCKAVQFGKDDMSALCAILGAEGVSYSQDGGTGADGSGLYGNNAVRRYANHSMSLSQSGDRVLAQLPKAIAMFATRACRGSIMIGTALNQGEMELIVERLVDVDQPWNCPHGRPTMRHVADLIPLIDEDDNRLSKKISGPNFSVMTQMSQAEASDTHSTE